MHLRSGDIRARDPEATPRHSKQIARRRAVTAILLAGSAVCFGLFLLSISPLGRHLYERVDSHSASHGIDMRDAQRLRDAALRERKRVSYGLPVRLMIPRLGIDAAVENVGLTADGAMGVPTSRETVAWFMLGSRPGNKGSAVIDGHSGYKNGEAVFDDLPSLRKGDLLFIKDAKGVMIEFIVRRSHTYGRDANASDVFDRKDGRHLNLVTCTGTWDASAGTHAQRLVVFADAMPRPSPRAARRHVQPVESSR